MDIRNNSHTLLYNTTGKYYMKVQAVDVYGDESDWSDPLSVTMPRNIGFNSLIMKLSERFPHAFPILKLLFGI